jgi:hypothetical protein
VEPHLDGPFSSDEWLALKLLLGDPRGLDAIFGQSGTIRIFKNDFPRLVFLSGNTKPTENEARKALCRVLRDRTRKPSHTLLDALAQVFDPDQSAARGYPTLRAALKRRGRGHSDPIRDLVIAHAVKIIRENLNETYEKAVDMVAEAIEKSPEQIKRICGKYPVRPLLRRRRRKPNR